MGEQSIWPRPAQQEVKEAAALSTQAAGIYCEASKLTEDPASEIYSVLMGCGMLGGSIVASPMQCWDPEGAGVTEAVVLGCMDLYTSANCGFDVKANLVKTFMHQAIGYLYLCCTTAISRHWTPGTSRSWMLLCSQRTTQRRMLQFHIA